MNNEEYKRPKEKIFEVMDSVPDKNNNYYKQVMETLKKREEWKRLDGEELAARRKQKMLTMDEVVEACHSFQHITDNADVGKVLFNYLSEPITNKKFWLKTIIQTKNGKHSEDVIEWAKEEHEKLTVEIQSGCLDLQDKLTSMETKNYIFSMTSDLFHSGTHRSFNYRELTNGEAAEKGYRKIAIDSFFGTKEEEQGIFELFYDYLKHVFPVAAELVRVEMNNKQMPHSTPHERKKVLDLLKNTEREKELVGSITKKLQSNEFQPSEDQVNRWINRYLKMDAEEIEAEKRKIVLAIEKLISKKTKEKDTALTNFRKDLVHTEQNIEGIMRTAFLAEINHNFYRTDKEEKFADCIYRSEEIRHWMKQNPALKEVFYECQKRVPFNEFSTWNNSKENEQVKPNIRDLFDCERSECRRCDRVG